MWHLPQFVWHFQQGESLVGGFTVWKIRDDWLRALEDTVSCRLILLKTGVCRYTSQTYQAKSLIPKLCQSNPLGDKSSLTRNNASVFPIEYFRWQRIDNNDVYYWISWLIFSIHQSGEEPVIMHLLCAIVQRVGRGPPPATIDYTGLVTGDWGLGRICSSDKCRTVQWGAPAWLLAAAAAARCECRCRCRHIGLAAEEMGEIVVATWSMGGCCHHTCSCRAVS